MKNKRYGDWFCYGFAGIFVGVLALLTILLVFMHCETNIYSYDMEKAIERHTPYIYAGIALAASAAVIILTALLERIYSHTAKAEMINRGIFCFCGLLILFAGIFWVSFNDSVPVYDQKDVYEEARRIAGVVNEPFDTEYFILFSRNRGVVLLVALAIRLFGDHYYSFAIFNLAGILIIYGSVCQITKRIYKNLAIVSVTSLALMLFYPLIIYATFMYGTVLSVAFTVLGLYAVVCLRETGKLRYAVIIVLAFPMGLLMHQSSAIGLVAAVIYLIIAAGKEKKKLCRNLAVSVCAVVMVFLSMRSVDMIYDSITGADPHASSVPVTCTIYMGITSTEGASGPGSQDGSYTDIFLENGGDGEAASRDAVNRIITVIGEYFTGKRSPVFFLEKIEYQWLDPTFGARKIIRMNDVNLGDPSNSEAFTDFYNSPVRDIIFKFSIGAELAVYLGAFIAGIKTLRSLQKYHAAVLIQLYVIGGFAFQLLWESLSRYCLGYFILLIPQAVFGLNELRRFFIARKMK